MPCCSQVTASRSHALLPDDPDPLPVGSTGTVVRVNPSTNQADVDWDNGRQLMLLLDVDPFQVIAPQPSGEPTCEGMADVPTDTQTKEVK